MFEKLNSKTALSVLIIGEIMTISAGAMIHMDTLVIMKLIAGFAGIWVVYNLLYKKSE